jgi:hypothetical protein
MKGFTAIMNFFFHYKYSYATLMLTKISLFFVIIVQTCATTTTGFR